jgi:1-acyl-sn-glycerol-3-phosphate acyltransferase
VRIRGIFAVTFLFLGLVVLDLVQRLIVAPLVWLLPSRRTVVLTAWIRLMARYLLAVPGYLGGAQMPVIPRIPGGPGVLILMNHQSVFDVPLTVLSVENGYPLVVTRERYSSWIPVISHTVRLYQHPVVNPTASPGTLRGMIKNLRATARNAEVPLTVFPEGTRTKDGEIGPLKVRGLELVLRTRPWKVYVVVADGFWRWAKVKDLIWGMSKIRGKMEVAGVLDWEDPKGDSVAFAGEVRNLMIERLALMRETDEPA